MSNELDLENEITKYREIRDIVNYYGILSIAEYKGRFYWGMEDWTDHKDWREIPESLYLELNNHQDAKENTKS